MPKRSLVTGGAGFMGSHTVDSLLALGHEVVALDDLSGGDRSNVPKGATFVEASVTDHELLAELFAQHRFDYVFHLAAYAAEGLSHFIRRFNYTNNVVGSVNLINESIKHEVKCFVFTSSIAVYGELPPPMTEDMVPQPEDPYGVAKLAVEHDLRAAKKFFGLDYVIFRPHNVYGSRQNLGDRYRNVAGIFMNQLMRGEPCTIFGDGTQTRAFTHVSDVAPAIARSVETPAALCQVINVGSDTPVTVNELADLVREAMGVGGKSVHVEARKEVAHAFCDHRKFSRVFGERRDPVGLREGLREMATWAKAKGPQSPSVFGEIEVDKGLPPIWAKASRKR
ncbi:MAG TPA: NAD-dependent epimerase/dehydratase family protein [Myxococcota bacterium]|nr:NAD-dependent epimerase/dehydratase family protein [Myxococcota bacterium]